MKHKLLLALFAVLLLAPGISYTIQAVTADSGMSDTAAYDSMPYGQAPVVYTMYVDDAIGTVTDDRIREAIGTATENDAELLVILLDTPGGFTKPTWSICKNILNSDVPVCMYIAPSGARAGSAGVYMTYSSHIAAMAPSTNIGAAHPVGGGGQQPDSVMSEKITNDAVAQIRASAERRGRNAEWAEQAVRESVSITDREALELNVIDLRAKDLDDLYAQLDGQEVELPEGNRTLNLTGVETREIEITFVHRILRVITSPDVAFILFSIGGLGLVLELYSPGAILPGVVGAICMILAFYSFQTLPINYAGVLLILLAIILFIAEVKVMSHGLLTVGGVVSLFLGGLMLVDTVDPALKVSWTVLITSVVIIGLVVSLVLWMVVKAARNRPVTGQAGMTGKKATMRKDSMIYVDGALWTVFSDSPLQEGDDVEVIGVDGLRLEVRKTNKR